MITTQVLLNEIKPILMYELVADEGKILYNGERYAKATEIFVEDLEQWQEIPYSDEVKFN
jgi:hypothetical protein